MAQATNFNREIQAFIDENLSPAARSKALAAFAREERDKLIASGEASRYYDTAVDGRAGASEDTVRGDGGGYINYWFGYVPDATEYALNFLRNRVPRSTGFLSEHFWVSVNGRYLGPGIGINYSHIPTDATVLIGNTAAYWRKAETNYVGKKRLNYRYPEEIWDCVDAINARYGKTAIDARRVYDIMFPNKYEPRHVSARGDFQSPCLMLRRAPL